MRAHGIFTVDDLKYLRRGGRISPTAATLGTMLDLKPIIVEDREGRLSSVAKVRGRKKALNYIVEKTVELMDDPKESPCFVLHADAPEDAEHLKEAIQAKIPDLEIFIYPVGPVIGAHCGPGLVASAFIGKERP